MATNGRDARPPSMVDVARVAGVSPQTVSRVANGETNVTDATRKKVLRAIKDVGYRPNAAARAMKRGTFKTIGIVYHSLTSPGTHRPVEALSRLAAKAGYATVLIPLDAPTQDQADGAFTRLGELLVDAVVVIMPNAFDGPSPVILEQGIPTIIQGYTENQNVGTVDFDHQEGVRLIVDHLLGLGHQTVHHIAGPLHAPDANVRREAWEKALTKAGRVVPEPAVGDWYPLSGYAAAKELLGQDPQPTAIFVANDQMALGAYRAVFEAGLRIPEDISIVGFDNLEETAVYSPPLTTIEQTWDLLGDSTLKMALEMMDGGKPGRYVVPTHLVLRDSTAPPSH